MGATHLHTNKRACIHTPQNNPITITQGNMHTKASPAHRHATLGLAHKPQQPPLQALRACRQPWRAASRNHANIAIAQDRYRQFVHGLQAALPHQTSMRPQTLYEKRKRACEAYMEKCRMGAMAECQASHALEATGVQMSPKVATKRCANREFHPQGGHACRRGNKVLWELVLECQAITDVKHNFIMREVAKIEGTKRRRT